MKQETHSKLKSTDLISGSLESFHASLPTLPSIIRYYDDFSDETKSIKTNEETWVFRIDAEKKSIIWKQFPVGIAEILKHFINWSVSKHDATSVLTDLIVINAHSDWVSKILKLFTLSLIEIKENWELQVLSTVMPHQALFARRISMFMCDYELGNWGATEKEFVKGWSWFPKTVKVQKTEYWQLQNLSTDEIGLIQTYFDTLSEECIRSQKNIDVDTLRNASIFYWCMYNAFRPMQIACLDYEDVVVRNNDQKSDIAVHATFYMAKQRQASEKMPMPRKIKRNWAILMAKWHEHRTEHSAIIESKSERKSSFFGLTPREISLSITNTVFEIVGRKITPTMLRHFAAQRCVDSGASQLLLAEFMGHKDISTGLIYFENSPTQASRVNTALGLSPVYKKVSEIACGTFIDKDELNALPDDNQIGGANHGIAFAGIGGCQLGQSLCQLNPAINCYTCPKFLPLNDELIHTNIGAELRAVVDAFVRSGRNDESNPAFMQLKHTLETIRAIVESLKSSER